MDTPIFVAIMPKENEELKKVIKCKNHDFYFPIANDMSLLIDFPRRHCNIVSSTSYYNICYLCIHFSLLRVVVN